MTTARVYDVPPFDGQDDYLADAGLDAIAERVLAKLPPDGFDLGHCNATRRGITATVYFGDDGNPVTNAERFEAMLQASTVVRTLHANLVAARAALAGDSRPSLHDPDGGRRGD